jgi:putative IMPACT (imprinted ancient) family translation regulator
VGGIISAHSHVTSPIQDISIQPKFSLHAYQENLPFKVLNEVFNATQESWLKIIHQAFSLHAYQITSTVPEGQDK